MNVGTKEGLLLVALLVRQPPWDSSKVYESLSDNHTPGRTGHSEPVTRDKQSLPR